MQMHTSDIIPKKNPYDWRWNLFDSKYIYRTAAGVSSGPMHFPDQSGIFHHSNKVSSQAEDAHKDTKSRSWV